MPLPTVDLVKMNLVGHSPSGEMFNVGLWLAPTVSPTQAQLDTMATDIAALITATAWTNIRTAIPSSAGYDLVRLYSYPAGFQKAQKVAEAPITGIVGSGTNYHPLQSAMVVTTRTGVPGQRSRGRFYMPAFAVPLQSDCQLGTSTLSGILNEWKTFINAVNQVANVQSATVVSQAGSGSNWLITQLTADSRLDIQRRRANREVPTFKAAYSVTL